MEVRDQIVFVRLEDFVTGGMKKASEFVVEDDEFEFEAVSSPLLEQRSSRLKGYVHWCASWLNAITPIR